MSGLGKAVADAYGRWCVCADHRLIFDATDDMMCPKSARRKSLVNADCQVAGTFKSHEAAERYLLRLEVAEIEDESAHPLAARCAD